jgi:hypothetical protein
MNPHAARGRLAASLRLLAAPLLDAQRRAWESGDHPGILLAGAVISSLINAAAGRAHLDGGGGRPSVVMNDGEHFAIFRRMHLDAPGQPAPSGEFRVRFQTRMAPQLNELFAWLPIPLFSGLPGFRDKTWLVNQETGFSAGIYHWQTVADAARYARSPALAFMTRRSVPGTVRHQVGPATDDLASPWPPEDNQAAEPAPDQI